MMTPEEVAAEMFHGKVSARWVRDNVRPKVRLGPRSVAFYEFDVVSWIESRRVAA
jgi:hypothetical protein